MIFSNLTGPLRVGSSSTPEKGGIAGLRSRSSNIRAPAPIPRIMDDLEERRQLDSWGELAECTHTKNELRV